MFAQTSLDASEVLDQDVCGLALLVEQPGLGEKGHEHRRLGEHLVELVRACHHLGWVQLEIDLVEVATRPASEMAVDVAPLVVEQPFRCVGIDDDVALTHPGGEAPFQLGECRLVLVVALGLPA